MIEKEGEEKKNKHSDHWFSNKEDKTAKRDLQNNFSKKGSERQREQETKRKQQRQTTKRMKETTNQKKKTNQGKSSRTIGERKKKLRKAKFAKCTKKGNT